MVRVLRNPDGLRGTNLDAEGGLGVFHGISDQAPRLRLTDADLVALDAALPSGARAGSRRLVVL